MNCQGCNVCQLSQPVAVPLTPIQTEFLIPIIRIFNRRSVLKSGRARLVGHHLVAATPHDLGRIAGFIFPGSRSRFEAWGIVGSMIKILDEKVFIYPMTLLNQEAMVSLIREIRSFDTPKAEPESELGVPICEDWIFEEKEDAFPSLKLVEEVIPLGLDS